jgi:hypothetical protein
MSPETRSEIVRLAAHESLMTHKIAWILGVSHFSVRYVLDHNGERAKSHARVRRWRERRRVAA